MYALFSAMRSGDYYMFAEEEEEEEEKKETDIMNPIQVSANSVLVECAF